MFCCSVTQLCLTLCDPMDCSMPGFPILHHLLERTQNSCPLSQWCNATISSSCHPLFFLPSIFPSIKVFSYESFFHIRWPNYWRFSFSITPFNEYSGLISFEIDWFDSCCSRESQESFPTPQFKSINSLALSLLHSPTLTSIHDHGKNHSLD